MSDYSCGWPLWLDDGCVTDDWFAQEHHLSPGLRRDLVGVQAFFDQRFNWDLGWREAGDDARYAEQIVDVLFRLRRELGDAWTVELDLWPVTDEATLGRLRRQRILGPPAGRRRGRGRARRNP